MPKYSQNRGEKKKQMCGIILTIKDYLEKIVPRNRREEETKKYESFDENTQIKCPCDFTSTSGVEGHRK